MQKFDNRSLIYAIIRTQERVPVRQGKRAIRARSIEVFSVFNVSFLKSLLIRTAISENNSVSHARNCFQ